MNTNVGRGFLKAVILVGLIFIVAYFFAYNKWLNQSLDNVDITYRIEDGGDSKISNNDQVTEKYKDLYSKINYELLQYNFGEEFYNIYYKEESFNDNYFIYTGLVNLIKSDIIVNCNLERTVSVSELDSEIKSIFGNVKYNNKSFTTKNNNVVITYNSNENNYDIKLNGKCSGFDFSNGGIKNIYKKAEIKDNSLYIYEKALYVENIKDNNGNITFNYYKDITKDSLILANSFDKVDVGDLPTYVYKFELENNQYTIKSISRVN